MDLERILEKSDELLTISDIDTLYMRIMRLLAEVMNVAASSIIIKDEKEPYLYFFFALGEKAEKLKKIKIPYGKGIVSHVIKNQESIIENNPEKNPYFYKEVDIRTHFQTHNILAVPLIGTRFTGALELINKFSGDFNKRDLKAAQFFAKFIASVLDNFLYKKQLETENISLKTHLSARYTFDDIIHKSPKMAQVISVAQKIARGEGPVLILGESGTGKELLAQAIHNYSKRKNRPFIAINCAAIPETLLESELFGYEKGAFTGANQTKLGKFELANGGTIFLDEISEMPLTLQAKLLRVLQEKEFERIGGTEKIRVNIRVIAATNKDINQLVKSGKFREDLYYRISVFPILLPPLRERKEDIEVLFKYFYKKFGGKIKNIPSSLIKKLQLYSWPGNVRELENFANRYSILGTSEILQDLNTNLFLNISEDMALEEAMREFKKHYIQQVLRKYNFNQTKAAQALNIQRPYLNRLIRQLNIHPRTE